MNILELSKKLIEEESELDKSLKALEELKKLETREVVVRTSLSCDTTDPWRDVNANLERNSQ